MSDSDSLISTFPPELLFNVAAVIFYAARPAEPISLDPPVQYDDRFPPPTALPSTFPPPIWPETLARKTLASFCLVSKSFYSAAKPWLWRRVEIRLPQTWLSLIDAVVDPSALTEPMEVDEGYAVPGSVSAAIEQVASKAIAVARRSSLGSAPSPDPHAIRESIIATLSAPPDESIPPELLTPPTSREPSPRRLQLRAKSPGRWRLLRDISTALQAALSQNVPGLYLPNVDDPHPARHIQHLDFNHFRTIGMRRLVEEGVSNRFVTADRLYRILQEMPNLLSFGATEYMDGALSENVLLELLFRGRNIRVPTMAQLAVKQGKAFTADEIEQDNWARRRECVALEALDLCGCVSAVFIAAMSGLLEKYVDNSRNAQESRRGRRGESAVNVSFPFMRRLGLRGAKSIAPNVLETFVLAFPNLTHLDISGTRCTPELLDAIGASDSLRLKALSLGRCPALTGVSIEQLLVRGRSTRYVKHLSLYGDVTFPNPLSESELLNIVTKAPCFLSGSLVYLDLSSAKITESTLKSFSEQPLLRSLGLSYVENLPLKEVASFVRDKCANIEILTLINTTRELLGPSARSISLSLHQLIISPLAKPPFSFSLTDEKPQLPSPTRLRVIELSNTSLIGLGAGSDGWKIVRSKGGRGWYVDSTSAWCATDARGAVLERNLGPEHPYRKEIERLANACGNVSSGVGWHARKMEILNGDGMLGREDGLYGAVSFAYNS